MNWRLASRGDHRLRFLYILLSLLALGLITTANRLGARGLQAVSGDRLLWLAGLCVPSFVVCTVLYLGVRPERPFAGPPVNAPWPRMLRLSGAWLLVWLAASAVAALVVGHWISYTTGVYSILCFVLIGPLQEELLYRGALFELAQRVWPSRRFWSPVIATTIPFALQHFQFHGYQLSRPALLQVGFTIPMGLVFGSLRSLSGSIWPGFVVHVLTNLPGAFGCGALSGDCP